MDRGEPMTDLDPSTVAVLALLTGAVAWSVFRSHALMALSVALGRWVESPMTD